MLFFSGIVKCEKLFFLMPYDLLCAEYAAYRNEMSGSYFIQHFCDVMFDCAHREPFDVIISQVTDG